MSSNDHPSPDTLLAQPMHYLDPVVRDVSIYHFKSKFRLSGETR